MKQTLKQQFEAIKKLHGSAYLTLSNLGGIEIILNNSNDGILYIAYGKLCKRWQKIKYTMSGRAYITVYGRRLYLDNFMIIK